MIIGLFKETEVQHVCVHKCMSKGPHTHLSPISNLPIKVSVDEFKGRITNDEGKDSNLKD